MDAYPQPQQMPMPGPRSAGTNVFGLIGLIAAILGFFTLVTAPIGLVLSLIGLRHPEKGLAIAGTIVGAISTIFAIVMALIFGTYIFAMTACCVGVSAMAKEEMAIKAAAEAAVAKELGKPASQIELKKFDSGLSSETPRIASGTAVWRSNDGKSMARDFTCTVSEKDDKWTASNVQFTSDPYEWIDLDEEEDPFGFDKTANKTATTKTTGSKQSNPFDE